MGERAVVCYGHAALQELARVFQVFTDSNQAREHWKRFQTMNVIFNV